MVGMVIIVFFVLLSLFANVVAPRNPIEQQQREAISAAGFYGRLISIRQLIRASSLGTDYLGRDVLSRVIYGSRVSLVCRPAADHRHCALSVSRSAWLPGSSAARPTTS